MDRMEDLLKGSGCECLMEGGASKAVAFVRKAMAKTKQMNNGYRPPARAGYDFPTAMRLDKPSKHIQRNIGNVAESKIKKFKYQRVKKTELSAEQKLRNEVMKPSYWGLSFDDFEEVDGNLVEKKHGLLWRPIFFKPTGSEKGCWGLRCCRYDKDGEKLPSSKKYEWIYFREQDECGDIPESPEKDIPTEADPPDKIENTVENEDGEDDEVVIERYFAKAKKNKFDYRSGRLGRPFFWADLYNEKSDDGVALPARKPTYKDIPIIISANRAMIGFIRTFQTSRRQYIGEAYYLLQQENWDKHLTNLERTDETIEAAQEAKMMRGRRGRPKTKEPMGKLHYLDFKPNERDKVEETGDKYFDKRGYKQVGHYKSTISKNKWGYIRAEKALADLEQRQEDNFERAKRFGRAISANEMLIDALIEEPDGVDEAELKKMAREGNEDNYFGDGLDVAKLRKAYETGNWDEMPEPQPIEEYYEKLKYNKNDAKALVEEAEGNLPA